MNDLYTLANNRGITIDSFRMHGKALTLDLDNEYFIALNPNLNSQEETEVLAHELGHCFTRGFYSILTPFETRERIETSANIWAYKKLLPPSKVQELSEKGIYYYWEFAEETGLSEEFVKNAIEYYMSVDLA